MLPAGGSKNDDMFAVYDFCVLGSAEQQNQNQH